jgi:prepilin-type N-terminal cleavage/methylation domain-containing protein
VSGKIRLGVPKSKGRSRESGFTLIELMIIVAIIGILAAIAIPNFMTLVHKSKRAEAYYVLKSVWTDQQGYFTEAAMFADGFAGRGLALELPRHRNGRHRSSRSRSGHSDHREPADGIRLRSSWR